MGKKANVYLVMLLALSITPICMSGCEPRSKGVFIYGKIIINQYEKGNIYVRAFDNKFPQGKLLQYATISFPTSYVLKLTFSDKDMPKRIYLYAYNDVEGDGLSPVGNDPKGAYDRNPLQLNISAAYETFGNIDITCNDSH